MGPKITLILGGARSGKSAEAVRLAKANGTKIAFVATAQRSDAEMDLRIDRHRKDRPKNWTTFEEPLRLAPLLKGLGKKYDLVVIDCLTLLVSNHMMGGSRDGVIEKMIRGMIKVLKQAPFKSIIVSNEAGLGVVPVHPLARRFRDVAGRANQITAKSADAVRFMVSGIAVKIKGD